MSSISILPTIIKDPFADFLEQKNFKTQLMLFDITNKNQKAITEELLNIIPFKSDPDEILNLIFKACSVEAIPILVKSMKELFPSLQLSPYNQLQKKIVKLSNDDFSIFDFFKKYTLDENYLIKEKLQRYENKIYFKKITSLSETKIGPDQFTLNFLWVNLNPQNRFKNEAQNIFNDGLNLDQNDSCIWDPFKLSIIKQSKKDFDEYDLYSWSKIKKTFIYKLSKWADHNPKCTLNLWYDSSLVTVKAKKKTEKVLRKISESRDVTINLKDIRKLPNLTGELENSLHPGTQLYFRVDLLKVLIAHYMMTSSHVKEKYFVFSDIDVEPMSSAYLFDRQTLHFLSHNGYVFDTGNMKLKMSFENSFFIFNKENQKLIEMHHKYLIEKVALKITKFRTKEYDKYTRKKNYLRVHTIYNQYFPFQLETQYLLKIEKYVIRPRKPVICPISKFYMATHFRKSDFKKEKFRFIGESNIPYTKYGRAYDKKNKIKAERQIPELIDWKSEPLED